MPQTPPSVIALVTDTHVRVEHDDGQLAFNSDATHNDRNRRIADVIQQMRPDLIIHLGDVVHPIPTLPTHRPALKIAAQIYGTLDCPLVVVPGNHDVGDKRTTANAPAQVAEGRAAFREQWGPPFRSLDLHDHHLVVVDGTLLDAGTDEAAEQRAWLEADLAQATGRIFLFTHYPPYLFDPKESEHYDNLGPEGRSWLLDLMVRHGVEAMFTGHVHRFFYNRYLGVDLYTLPSAAFARPEYAALRPVSPEDAENGRDDREHLGVTQLTITPTDHHLTFYRPHGRSPTPGPRQRLGTWLRHRLGRPAEVPYGDLDALTRKTARDDARMIHLLDLGLSHIRIPFDDLHDEAVRDRVAWLARQGIGCMVFSAGLPTPLARALHQLHAPDMDWEVVVRPGDVERLAQTLASWTGPGLILGRIGKPWDASAGGYHSHFPREGFDPLDPALRVLLDRAQSGAVAGIAYRIADDQPVQPQVQAALARSVQLGVRAICHVELPFATEATRQRDDARVANRVADAAAAAEAHPEALILLDLLVDKDRGYWCRNALLDAADQPREAYQRLKNSGLQSG